MVGSVKIPWINKDITTNQRHAPAASSTSFSLLFKISNRNTVSHFDAFYNIAFRDILFKIK